jgi:hypothetical protein
MEIIQYPAFDLKHNVSETELCHNLQVKPTPKTETICIYWPN